MFWGKIDSHVKDEFRDLQQPPLQVMSSSNPGSGVASFVGNLFSIKSVQPGDLDFFEALTPWKPSNRPQYLQDLTGEMTVPDCSCKSPMGLGDLD
jgi:hypothetical protein